MMGIISRGVKNAFRNSVRSFSIILILGISISMSLVMLMSLRTVQQKINDVKGSIGNYVTVSPAGIRGFEGGGELLTENDVSSLTSVAHVSKVIKAMTDRLSSGTDTNLSASIEPGSFGNRQRQVNDNSGGYSPGDVPPREIGGSNQTRSFTMPITVMATSDLSSLASLNISQFNITAGENIAADSSELVALVGKDLATKNSLGVGSTFQAHGKEVTVRGIYDTGNTFTNGSVIMPLSTVQSISDQAGQLTSVIVQADNIDNVSSVTSAIKEKLGSKADVVSQQDSSNSAVAPLENIKTISLYSLIGALVAGAVIILLTMIMIVRERRREIGVLKAIGAANTTVMGQFAVESLVLTLSSSLIGILLGIALANPILKVMLNNSESASQAGPRMGGGPGGGMMMRLGNAGIESVRNLTNTVGWEIIAYGIGAAVIIAIIGSAIPSFIIAKVRPAEVMRAE